MGPMFDVLEHLMHGVATKLVNAPAVGAGPGSVAALTTGMRPQQSTREADAGVDMTRALPARAGLDRHLGAGGVATCPTAAVDLDHQLGIVRLDNIEANRATGGQEGQGGGCGERGGSRTGHGGRGGRGGRKRGRLSGAALQGTMTGEEQRTGCYDANAEDVTLPAKKLKTPTRTARNELLQHLNGAFKLLCGVLGDERWPTDPDEERKNPRAPDEVRRAVTDHVWSELKTPGNLGEKLTNQAVKWNKESLFVLSKTTFTSLKEVWQVQNNSGREAAKARDDRELRRYQRRKAKASRLLGVIDEYKEEHHGNDPTEMIIADLMWDEESGPEEGSDETLEEWKVMMARGKGVNPRGDAFGTATFHELETILAWLRAKRWELLDVKKRKQFTTHMVHTDRMTSRIPTEAPWDCCINAEWHAENVNQPEYEVYKLGDWYRYGDPPAFKAPGPPQELAQATSSGGNGQPGPSGGDESVEATPSESSEGGQIGQNEGGEGAQQRSSEGGAQPSGSVQGVDVRNWAVGLMHHRAGGALSSDGGE
ncbi:hypothetical protein CONPUDRAFT_160561 [Coniophora puteana RWD-64-598 SS2]|uniref:Uncharacterized protein n=1 Tax=Coniophora puteana (strain RWD-64-598) TaxID=741705 RepID=R7SCN6_CONPW|nr:uncharacterized protein CONPUDRAFT_160561 [Coniophora puteana RWD-64-598 SS2]EIW73931.1 hypothetical protein CONPUDRAFT_160561 [Coniophora puteana RWD-64-598 SS2]